MKKIFLIISMLVVSTCSVFGAVKSSVPATLYGGFPISNFAMAAQVPDDGSMYGNIIRNTGELGGWLLNCGTVEVAVQKDGRTYGLKDFGHKELHRDFPIVSNTYQDSRKLKATLKLETFCPLTVRDEEETALPAIMLQADVKATADEAFDIVLSPKANEGQQLTITTDRSEIAPAEGVVTIPFRLKKGESARVRVVITQLDKTWVAAKRFDDAKDVARYVLPRWDVLRLNTEAFDASLPYSGDKNIDAYLQYYLLPALILTRMSADDEVLTMGYNELNQRDSFWTTWMHLVLFRDLEWKMIQESYDNMRPSGKIPTCILPEIERWDDLDINLFLILRTARYYAYYRDWEKLSAIWPHACRCMDWVIGRDISHEGLPEQVSFWCDWKDVQYMQDRRYSPFVAMLYLAALDQMAKMADVVGDSERKQAYKQAYARAYDKTNRSTEDGGLWNGRYYAQIWKDGSARELLTQDQMVGVLYGVMPPERAESVMHELDTKALTPYGICNMWPYIEGASDREGVYHNGAMWPWLSFMDCWARIESGHSDRAISLMQTIFKADIVDSGDYVPNEHINTKTGENLGFAIQGWNADLFGLMYFGLRHKGLSFKL
ncbi:MAG: hypothetical protein KBT10_03075 [Bacteroidales bacterium]|nr:hypothetical protein [Candidatus Sodaliphilus aphodohippi]